MNNLKNMLSKSLPSADANNTTNTQSDEALSIDDFFADVMKAAYEKASENYSEPSSIHWKTDVNTFRSGAGFALKWFAEKIGEDII